MVTKKKKLPTYFTPSDNNAITIKYVMFVAPDDQEEKQDILNYRTRKFAEQVGAEWFSETCIGPKGDIGAIYIFHTDSEIVVQCAIDIVNYLKKHSYIKFLPDGK